LEQLNNHNSGSTDRWGNLSTSSGPNIRRTKRRLVNLQTTRKYIGPIRSIPDKIKTENKTFILKGLVIHPKTSDTPEIVIHMRKLSPLHNTMPNDLFRCQGF